MNGLTKPPLRRTALSLPFKGGMISISDHMRGEAPALISCLNNEGKAARATTWRWLSFRGQRSAIAKMVWFYVNLKRKRCRLIHCYTHAGVMTFTLPGRDCGSYGVLVPFKNLVIIRCDGLVDLIECMHASTHAQYSIVFQALAGSRRHITGLYKHVRQLILRR